MVLDKEFTTIQSKVVKFKPNLNCESYGVYAALSTNCDGSYLGQKDLVIDKQLIED